jgi:hypothetical protein
LTILAKLRAYERDYADYITYVFECLDKSVHDITPYVMCTRYPNWNHRDIQIDEIGYLNIEEVKGGVDTYYDGTKQVLYRYDAIRFIKFIELPKIKNKEFTM